MQIAVLGMGRMGQAVAVRVAASGHDVTVWNRSPGKAGEALEAGATEASSLSAAVLGAGVVVTSLATDDAVRAVALGPDGVRGSLREDQLYVDASTISPDLSSELAAAFDHFVAMPILGAPNAVAAGKATYLAGGPTQDLDTLQPVLAALTETVLRFPTAELASVAKVTSNSLLLSGIVALAEALTVGRAGGLSDDQLTALLGDSAMVSPGVRNRFEAVLTGKGPEWWTVELGAKDAGLALAVGQKVGAFLPGIRAVHDRYATARDNGLADRDIAAVSQLYRD